MIKIEMKVQVLFLTLLLFAFHSRAMKIEVITNYS